MDATPERALGTPAGLPHAVARQGRRRACAVAQRRSSGFVLSACPRSRAFWLGTDPQGLLARTIPRGNGPQGPPGSLTTSDRFLHHLLADDMPGSSFEDRMGAPGFSLHLFSQVGRPIVTGSFGTEQPGDEVGLPDAWRPRQTHRFFRIPSIFRRFLQTGELPALSTHLRAGAKGTPDQALSSFKQTT